MVHRTLNLRVLAVTFVAAATLGGTALLVQRWQVSRTAKTFLSHAQAQEAEEDWLKAAEYFERYLRLLPTDAAVRVQLAQAYGKGAKTLPEKRQAVSLHFRALGAGGAEQEAELRQRLAELLVETGRHLEAEQEARKVLATQPQHAKAHRALALSLWNQVADGSLAGKRTGQVGVVRWIVKAGELNAGDIDLAVVAATLYREQGPVVLVEFPQSTEPERQESADKCLDKLVAAAGGDHKSWLARHLYRERYRLPGADADLSQALKIKPDDPAVLMTVAAAALRRGQELSAQAGQEAAAKAQYSRAKECYAQLATLKGIAVLPEWHLGLGAAHLGLGDVKQALVSWRKGVKHFTQPTVQAEFQAHIADTLLAQQRLDEAQAALKGLDDLLSGLDASVSRDRRVALQQAHDLRWANWYLQQQQPLAAVAPLRQVISRFTSREIQGDAPLRAWLMLGQAFAALGDWLEAASAYDRAVALAPRMPAAHAAAANAWLLAGRPDLASERAEEAIAHQSSITAWITLAAAQTQMQASLATAQQSWLRCEEALANLERAPAEKLGDAPWRIALLRADYLLAKAQALGEPERGAAEVAAALRSAEGQHPAASAFWALLVAYYQQLGATADADRALAHLRALPATAALSAIAEARLAKDRKEYGRAQAILEKAATTLSTADAARLRGELVNVALARQDYALARSLLARQLREQPQNLTCFRRLAEIDLETKNFAGLVEWEQKLEATGLAGQSLAGYYRACRLLVTATSADDPKLREALIEQARAAAQRPAWAEIASLRGMIEQRLGHLEAAADAYEQAIELGERRTLVFEQLIGLLDQLNRPADCEKYLSRMQTQLPLSQRLTELAGTHQVKSDRPQEAVAIARLAVERRPTDVMARVWLGRLLMITGVPLDAQEQFRQAIQLGPTDVRSWNGLFSYQLRQGDTQSARQTLDELVRNVPLEPAQRSFVLAQGHELIGDAVESERHYREAARLSPDSGAVQLRLAGLLLRTDPTQAVKCLDRALEIDPKSILARRMLAVVLASRGGSDDLARVESLLADAGTGDRIASEDQRLKALLLAQRGGADSLSRAIKLLENLIERGVGSGPSDRLILAQLLESLGRLSADPKDMAARFAAARQQLLHVAARTEAEPTHLAALVGYLLRHQRADRADRADEAGVWLDKLESNLSQATRDKADSIAQLVGLRLQHGSADHCGPWLDRLAKTDVAPLRLLGLRTRWLAATDPRADIAAIVEPQAQLLLAAATDDKERQRVRRDLGNVYAGAGKFEAAERWYRQLAAADPSQFHLVASALAKQGRIGEAIGVCEQAALIDVTSQPAVVLAAVLVDNAPQPHDFRRAEPVLASAMQKFADDERLLYAVGVLRVFQGRYEESIGLLRRVVDLNPKNVPALNNLALLLAEDPKSRKEALALIDKAIDISGSEADLLDTKGAILVYDGQSAQAVTLLEAAARSASSDPRYSFHLAVAYRDLGKTAQAKVELQSALDRELELQVLTSTDRRLLEDLKGVLTP